MQFFKNDLDKPEIKFLVEKIKRNIHWFDRNYNRLYIWFKSQTKIPGKK